MAKPTNLFRWATGVGAAAEPAEAKKTEGWIFAERPPPRMMNWLFNGAHQWFTYLNGLHNEPEFLNKIYNWSGPHAWGPVGNFSFVIFGDTLTGNGRIDINGAVEGGGVFIDHATSEFSFRNARSRAKLIPLVPVMENGENSWSHSRILGASSPTCFSRASSNTRRFMVPIHLDSGSVLTAVHAVVQDSGSSVLSVRCWQQNEDFQGLNHPTLTQIGNTYSTGGGGSLTLAIITGIVPTTIDNENHTYWVEFSVPSGSDVNWVRGLKVGYNDLGPRNR